MKKSVLPVVLSISLALTLGGCAGLPDVLSGGDTATPQSSSTPAPEFSQPFDANDVMFAQMMIVHHQQAVDMALLAQSNTSNPDVLELADQILEAQQPEIDTMNSWLDAAGATSDHMHSMTMPGLADEMTMSDLAAARDENFDSLFLMTMIAHHEGAVTMANDVLATTANDDVIALSNAIIAAQTEEIGVMYALLGP